MTTAIRGRPPAAPRALRANWRRKITREALLPAAGAPRDIVEEGGAQARTGCGAVTAAMGWVTCKIPHSQMTEGHFFLSGERLFYFYI